MRIGLQMPLPGMNFASCELPDLMYKKALTLAFLQEKKHS
jgi:hypothetical protein